MKLYHQMFYVVNMASCHVITMHRPGCVLIEGFEVGPQILTENNTQPRFFFSEKKRLSARLSMGV